MYANKRIMIGLSAGINSAAVLCWLIESGQVPSELHLYYAHFTEHSPDSFQFTADCIRYARKCFPSVTVKVTRNSVMKYFESQNLIPHPTNSTCSKYLKILPMQRYCYEHNIEVDLVGYVRTEARRIKSQIKRMPTDLFFTKQFPIQIFDDEWCFEIVDKHIGWHPAIYDIRDESGKRVFKHNNCLPCKNMSIDDMKSVAEHYPDKMKAANELSEKLKRYWGRDPDEYYTTFGKQDYEPQCEHCTFD